MSVFSLTQSLCCPCSRSRKVQLFWKLLLDTLCTRVMKNRKGSRAKMGEIDAEGGGDRRAGGECSIPHSTYAPEGVYQLTSQSMCLFGLVVWMNVFALTPTYFNWRTSEKLFCLNSSNQSEELFIFEAKAQIIKNIFKCTLGDESLKWRKIELKENCQLRH